MVTKTITITEDAYNSIKGLKRGDESFSQLFKRISKGEGVIHKYFGILSGNVEDSQKELKKRKKEQTKDHEKRYNALFGHKRSS